MNCLGVKDLKTKAPVDSNTLFQIGSCSKAIAATNIAQFVDAGNMSWDDPIIKYYTNSSEFQLNNSNITNSITIRDCLLMRSGLPKTVDLDWKLKF